MAFISSSPFLRLAHLVLLGFYAAGSAASQCPGGGAPSSAAGTAKALYLITNDEANAVVALRIGADGLLSGGSVTQTSGAGSVALNTDNQPATPDALVSQYRNQAGKGGRRR